MKEMKSEIFVSNFVICVIGIWRLQITIYKYIQIINNTITCNKICKLYKYNNLL